jgi:hypothetical protein
LEAKKLSFLKKEEEQWRLKCHDLWIKEGDENAK